MFVQGWVAGLLWPRPFLKKLSKAQSNIKFCERHKGAQPVSTTPVANFSTSFASVVDTAGKFATGVYDTGGKFATSVNNAGGKLSSVSTTPAANLPPVSVTLVANNGSNYQTANNLK